MELRTRWNGCEVYLHQGDITDLTTDAIVNAANSDLWAGGGVCGAIHRRAGRALAEECSLIISRSGKVSEGQAAITTGGDLPARHVIHAVGPFYEDDPARARAAGVGVPRCVAARPGAWPAQHRLPVHRHRCLRLSPG